jgi:DNA-binding MarR family transcriptional regulator
VNVRETGHEELARNAWEAMSRLVLDNERKREVAEATGLSFAKTRALRRLLDGALTMSELAERLRVDRPNLTTLVDDLEVAGLVQRRRHSSDRRITLVAATPTGLRLARCAEGILNRPPTELLAMHDDDLEFLVRLLARPRELS